MTGAGGFIGSHLVEVLREAGIPVRAADLPAADLSAAEALGCETAALDLTERASLDSICEGVDVVYHVAAIFDFTTPYEVLEKVNVEGARQLALAAHAAGATRFVFFSSVGVYGRPAYANLDEDGPKQPGNAYERSKWEGEQVVLAVGRETGLATLAIRPTLVYGPRSRFGHAIMIGFYAMRASARRPRPLPGMKGGPLMHSVHARDVARGALHVARHGEPGEAYNVADRTPITLGQFAELLSEGVGLPPGRALPYVGWVYKIVLGGVKRALPLVHDRADAALKHHWGRKVDAQGLQPAIPIAFDPEWLNYPTRDHSYDVSKLAALGFEWERPDVRVSLPETIRWYQDHKWIPVPASRLRDV